MSLDIKTQLNYSKDEGPGHRPYYFARSMTEQEKQKYDGIYGGGRANVDITVLNGRGQNLKLNQNSFELVQQKTSLSTQDFYKNQNKIKKDYYEEISKLIKKHTGAQYVHVIHHQVRNQKKSTGDIQNLNTDVQGYAHGIHSDSHPHSAQQTFKHYQKVVPEVKNFTKGRFLYINAWRNITDTPIEDNHLAVCDETSLVKPDDYITSDLFGEGYSLQQYVLNECNSKQHKWYYFPQMKKDEVILFKQWDSDLSLSGRVCFHTAFQDPNLDRTKNQIPVRESIEVRAFAYFPDHQPNTCPEIKETQISSSATSEEKELRQDVDKLLSVFDQIYAWPKSAIDWLRSQAALGEKGYLSIVKTVVKDDLNYQGLKNKSDDYKKKLEEILIEEQVIIRIQMGIAKLPKGDNSNLLKFTGYIVPLVIGIGLGYGLNILKKK